MQIPATAAIHDVDYWLGGDEEDLLAADKAFLHNAYIEGGLLGLVPWPLAWQNVQIQAAY